MATHIFLDRRKAENMDERQLSYRIPGSGKDETYLDRMIDESVEVAQKIARSINESGLIPQD